MFRITDLRFYRYFLSSLLHLLFGKYSIWMSPSPAGSGLLGSCQFLPGDCGSGVVQLQMLIELGSRGQEVPQRSMQRHTWAHFGAELGLFCSAAALPGLPECQVPAFKKFNVLTINFMILMRLTFRNTSPDTCHCVEVFGVNIYRTVMQMEPLSGPILSSPCFQFPRFSDNSSHLYNICMSFFIYTYFMYLSDLHVHMQNMC